jgi:hypothetical protein
MNTNERHPLARGLEHSDRRRQTGTVPLSPLSPSVGTWSVVINVGSPAENFTGQSLFQSSAVVETDHIMCSLLRHGGRRYVVLWP